MKNSTKFGEINYGKERTYRSELDRIQYAGESPERESIQDLYGDNVESASFGGKNNDLYGRIAALNEWNRNIQRDLLSKDDKVRQRARIRAAAMTDAVDVVNVDGVWKVRPRGGDA